MNIPTDFGSIIVIVLIVYAIILFEVVDAFSFCRTFIIFKLDSIKMYSSRSLKCSVQVYVNYIVNINTLFWEAHTQTYTLYSVNN